MRGILEAIIFANWRGFSGGTRDMYNEILKLPGAVMLFVLRGLGRLICVSGLRGFEGFWGGGGAVVSARRLRFGAMIVDALVDYEHPIFIYIPKRLGANAGTLKARP